MPSVYPNRPADSRTSCRRDVGVFDDGLPCPSAANWVYLYNWPRDRARSTGAAETTIAERNARRRKKRDKRQDTLAGPVLFASSFVSFGPILLSRRNPPYLYYPAAPPAPICRLPHTPSSSILLLCYNSMRNAERLPSTSPLFLCNSLHARNVKVNA